MKVRIINKHRRRDGASTTVQPAENSGKIGTKNRQKYSRQCPSSPPSTDIIQIIFPTEAGRQNRLETECDWKPWRRRADNINNNNNNIIKRPTLPDVQSMTGTRKHIDTIRPAMVLSAVIEREMRGGRPERRLAAAPATSKPPTLKQQQSTRINWKLSTRLTSFHRCQRQAQTFQFNSIQFNSIQVDGG